MTEIALSYALAAQTVFGAVGLQEAAPKAPNNNPIGIILFILVVGATAFLFYKRLDPMLKLVLKGKKENRFDQPGKRLYNVLIGWLFQRRIFRRIIPGLFHATLFWGFLIVNIGVAFSIFYGMFPIHLPLFAWRPTAIVVDTFLVLILVTLVYFGIRRAFIKPYYLTMTRDGWLTIMFISLSVITELLIEAMAWRADPVPQNGYPPVGRWLGELLLGPNQQDLALTLWTIFYWAKIIVVASFLLYIPTSKHFHVFTSIFNTFFQTLKPKGQLPKIENIEDLEHYGASKVEDFTWKDLFDTAVCTECGRCTSVCPANQTGKPLNPKKIIIDLKAQLWSQSHIPMTGHTITYGGTRNEGTRGLDGTPQADPAEVREAIGAGAADSGSDSATLPPLVRGMITEDELWACTTCRACMTECPVYIEHVPKIIDMRRYLVMEESEFPQEVIPLFNNLERNGNPWQQRNDERGDWVEKLPFEVKVLGALDEGDEVDVLFWTGCMAAFDARNKKIAQRLATILEEAGLNWGILGPEETCTGDPARRIGNEYLYQMMAEQNIETLNGYKESVKLKKIVTACPHCFNTIKNEYPLFGGNFEVVHHTKLIAELIEEGRIKVAPDVDVNKLTYHDPCYLGRYNDIYDAPRFVLNSLGNGLRRVESVNPGASADSSSGPQKLEFVEMERNKSKSFCCGGGGGRAWMEEHIGKRVNQTRVQEAADTGAEVVAAACPFCITMFEDGIKGRGLEGKLRVLDVTELIQIQPKQKVPAVSGGEVTPQE
jgi:Fe-S oxidoreductase